MFKFELPEK